ncbi:MAG: TetR/AcrR family transcriptional regulator [Rhizobiaceae bacterium]|nr:TetR/AcrR family transcriptional regulator [Rhizobiaceae bacterium]
MSNISNKADEIVRSARGLIVAGGYNSFSFADISAEVSIRKASIHHHFPTKADLVKTVVARYREEALHGLAMADANIADPLARLRAYTGFWEACIRDNNAPFCICAMLAAELPVLPGEVTIEVRGHFRDLSGWLATVLQKGVAEGRLVLSRPAAEEALSFMATVHGAMLSARAYGDPLVFTAIIEPLFDRIAIRH